MNTQLESSLALVKARQAVIAAQKSLAEAERDAKELRVRQAMQPLWDFLTPLLDQPSQHYRFHCELTTIPLRKHLGSDPMRQRGEISFYGGDGNNGLSIWFNADDNTFKHGYGNGPIACMSPDEALQKLVDHVARVLVTTNL